MTVWIDTWILVLPLTEEIPPSNLSLRLVFVGNSAIIAFLPLVRDIIRRRTGPSPFTECNYSNTMLETQLQPTCSTTLHHDEPNISRKRELVDVFFAAVSRITISTRRPC